MKNQNPIQTQKDIDNAKMDEIDRLASQGKIIAVDAELARKMGAFEENALSSEDALDSKFPLDEEEKEALNHNTNKGE